MIYNEEKKEIISKRELNDLDKFALEFTDIIKKYADYVIVSGYVSILLGRSRATEDIDLLIPSIKLVNFILLWDDLKKSGFECINTSNPQKAFNMLEEHAIRFFKGVPIPNIELKIIKNDLDKYSYENKIKVILGEKILFISPLELQIAYKLFLAAEGPEAELQSDKDIEDAKHLYTIFKEEINKEELLYFSKKLNVEGKLRLLK